MTKLLRMSMDVMLKCKEIHVKKLIHIQSANFSHLKQSIEIITKKNLMLKSIIKNTKKQFEKRTIYMYAHILLWK
jgi:hypothetical protein